MKIKTFVLFNLTIKFKTKGNNNIDKRGRGIHEFNGNRLISQSEL